MKVSRKNIFAAVFAIVAFVLGGVYVSHAQTGMMDVYRWEPGITRYNTHYDMMNYGLGGYGSFGGGLVMVLFWVLVVAGIVALVRYTSRDDRTHSTPSSPSPQHNSAMDILKERYARGEIEKEEFETKKKDLEQ